MKFTHIFLALILAFIAVNLFFTLMWVLYKLVFFAAFALVAYLLIVVAHKVGRCS